MNIDIRVPYTTRPAMQRRVGQAFVQQPVETKIALKRVELATHGEALWGVTEDAEQASLIEAAARHCGRPVTNNMMDLALSFQEDLAIMHQGRLAAVCFCFPSGWRPAHKLGLTLAEIHEPVADNADLVRMSQRLAQTMADPVLGGFQRTVWTVTANPNLSNLPGAHQVATPHRFEDLYFRWETQTTEPLGDGVTSLFFVDVTVLPLQQVWSELGNRIQDSINSMSDAVLDYKHLREIKMIINLGV